MRAPSPAGRPTGAAHPPPSRVGKLAFSPLSGLSNVRTTVSMSLGDQLGSLDRGGCHREWERSRWSQQPFNRWLYRRLQDPSTEEEA
jgi:hypothetical protein